MSDLKGKVIVQALDSGEKLEVMGADFDLVDGGDGRSDEYGPYVTPRTYKVWVQSDTAGELEGTVVLDANGVVGKPTFTSTDSNLEVKVGRSTLARARSSQQDDD